MKKQLSTLLNVVVSCLFAAVFFFLLWLISSGADTSGIRPVKFSENGDVLHFFGETLYISRDSVMGILRYPAKAASFCLELLPLTLSSGIKSFAAALSENASSAVTLVLHALGTFFTIGTRF